MTTQKDVLEFFCTDTKAGAKRNIYKNTDCGAWISFNPTGIVIGSIVEGLDFGTTTYPLHYADNFTGADLQARIDAVEREASALWEWGNRPCDKNGKWRKNGSMTMADLGCDAPDIDCEYGMFEQGERSS